MKAAMRARDTARLSAVRLLLAALKQKEIDGRIELSDSDVVAVIDKMIKQRRDSITQYEAGKRQDLADMGKVMAILKPRLAGRADMGKVSALVKSKLAG